MKTRFLVLFFMVVIQCGCSAPNSKPAPEKEKAAPTDCRQVEARTKCVEQLRNLSNQGKLEAFERKFAEVCASTQISCRKAEVPAADSTKHFPLTRPGDSLFEFYQLKGTVKLFFVQDRTLTVEGSHEK